MARGTVEGDLDQFVAGPDYYDYRELVDGFESLAALLLFERG